MSIEELNRKAEDLKNSKFNHGEPVLFAVQYAFITDYSISTALFSTADKALKFANSIHAQIYGVFPVNDIWGNPKQVDSRI